MRDPSIKTYDISGFKFIYINPAEFKLVATQVTRARWEFLFSWRAALARYGIPVTARSKIDEFLDVKSYGPLKICG